MWVSQYLGNFLDYDYLTANGPGDRGSIPGRVIPKTQKMELDASLLNTQHYKVQIKGKWNNPGRRVMNSPTPWCSGYWKGKLLVVLNYGRLNLLTNLLYTQTVIEAKICYLPDRNYYLCNKQLQMINVTPISKFINNIHRCLIIFVTKIHRLLRR